MYKWIVTAFLFLLLAGVAKPAEAFSPVPRHWTQLAHESQIVGIIRVEGLERGDGERPPLLWVKLIRLFKGEYSAPNYNLDKLFLDLTDKIHPLVQLDPEGKNLGMEYKTGQLFLAYLSPTKRENFLNQRVMAPTYWAMMTLNPINANILGYSDDRERGASLRDTYNFLNALDRFCEIDALKGDERQLALRMLEGQLKRYPNADLDSAYRWLSLPPQSSAISTPNDMAKE